MTTQLQLINIIIIIIIIIIKYYAGDQFEENELGRAYSGTSERCTKDFSGETWGIETTWKTCE